MIRRAAAIGLVALLAGCSRPASRDDAPGTYVLHLRDAADTLWVRPDGGYTHLYVRDGAAPVVSRDTWTFGELMDRPSVMFTRFPLRGSTDLAADPSRRGYWPVFIEHTWSGAVVLPVDPDGRAQYHRISRRQLGSGGKDASKNGGGG